MNRITPITNVHEDLMILPTRRVQRVEVTIRSILLESITQHQTILNDVKVDGLLCLLLECESHRFRWCVNFSQYKDQRRLV